MPEIVEEKNIAEEEVKENQSEERSYYYDDSCGYEIYIDEEDKDFAYETHKRHEKIKVN